MDCWKMNNFSWNLKLVINLTFILLIIMLFAHPWVTVNYKNSKLTAPISVEKLYKALLYIVPYTEIILVQLLLLSHIGWSIQQFSSGLYTVKEKERIIFLSTEINSKQKSNGVNIPTGLAHSQQYKPHNHHYQQSL